MVYRKIENLIYFMENSTLTLKDHPVDDLRSNAPKLTPAEKSIKRSRWQIPLMVLLAGLILQNVGIFTLSILGDLLIVSAIFIFIFPIKMENK